MLLHACTALHYFRYLPTECPQVLVDYAFSYPHIVVVGPTTSCSSSSSPSNKQTNQAPKPNQTNNMQAPQA